MSMFKDEYNELEKQRQDLYNRQIGLYKSMIADKEFLGEGKREYNELEKQRQDLYNRQIDLYKSMIADEYTPCEHI